MHTTTVSIPTFFLYSKVFASLGWPGKYQVDASLIMLATTDWFAGFIQQLCYVIICLKKGKTSSKCPQEKNSKAKTEADNSAKIYLRQQQQQCQWDKISIRKITSAAKYKILLKFSEFYYLV